MTPPANPPMIQLPYRTLLVLLLGLLLGACRMSPREPDPQWRSTELESVSERILWIHALNGLQRLRFPVGTDANPSERRVKTGWKTDLAPFRGDGKRQFAELLMEPVGERLWNVKVRVASQANMALSNPLDPQYAKWEWRADDPRQADILLQTIRSSIQAPLEAPSEPTEEGADRP